MSKRAALSDTRVSQTAHWFAERKCVIRTIKDQIFWMLITQTAWDNIAQFSATQFRIPYCSRYGNCVTTQFPWKMRWYLSWRRSMSWWVTKWKDKGWFRSFFPQKNVGKFLCSFFDCVHFDDWATALVCWVGAATQLSSAIFLGKYA